MLGIGLEGCRQRRERSGGGEGIWTWVCSLLAEAGLWPEPIFILFQATFAFAGFHDFFLSIIAGFVWGCTCSDLEL